jgi:hypothetical protein
MPFHGRYLGELAQSRDAGFVTFLYEKPIPIFQDIAQDYTFGGYARERH